ncbi:MAG TPA: Spy/CpxP family protein refolding chaperone [Steroidobacteraceae bacterium]
MKLNSHVSLWVLAVASIGGAAGVANAQSTTPATTTTTTTTTAPAHGGHKWHRHHGGGMLVGITLRATKQLNLTADQQASIKTILTTAHAQAKAAHAAGQAPVDMAVLGNPGDANYATALQSAKSLASTRIQNESELQSQIYNVLTPAQKAQLPTVLAAIKAQAQQRRAAWEQKHATGTTGAG